MEHRYVERAAVDELLEIEVAGEQPGGPLRRFGPSESGGSKPITPMNGPSGTSTPGANSATLRFEIHHRDFVRRPLALGPA